MSVIQNDWATTDWCRHSWCRPTGYSAVPGELVMITPGVKIVHGQWRVVAYNVTQMRVLWEVKTDGVEAENYTASSEASADKGIVNVKSDIIEKYWEATGKTAEWFQLDAGAGVTISMDTFAIIAHNLSGSAVVTLKGHGDGSASAPADWDEVAVYATLAMPDDPVEDNLIYVAPALPAASYRWWRVDIADPSNTENIRIGRVVGGSALIFVGENCLDRITFVDANYKDEQQLNGFTSIANNRALKKRMTLRFRDIDRISQTNYRLLRRYWRYSRDTLKSLIIVDPSSETSRYQYTVFAKLARMPEQEHVYISEENAYTTFDLDYDEGR